MSTASTIPLFGQAYKLTVEYKTATGTQLTTLTCNTWEPEALRITFEILQSSLATPFGFADIVIYNMSAATVQDILFGATWVSLEAGFQTGPTQSSQIWAGPVLQVLYDRENVVDQRVTLHCVYNPLAMTQPIAFSLYGASQTQMLAAAAAQINLPPITQKSGTTSAYAQQAMDAKQYPRGITVFGTMGKQLDTVANDQFLTTTRDGTQAYITEMAAPGAAIPAPSFVFSPPVQPGDPPLPSTVSVTSSIIGTPKQTTTGVIFTVLLDPRLKFTIPIQVVQLIRTLPSQIAIQPNPSGGNLVTPFDNNLTFFVSQVRHIGDSRGNDWYTEVTGYSTTYASHLLGGAFGSASL